MIKKSLKEHVGYTRVDAKRPLAEVFFFPLVEKIDAK